jgi:hypothetical protein
LFAPVSGSLDVRTTLSGKHILPGKIDSIDNWLSVAFASLFFPTIVFDLADTLLIARSN